MIYVLFFDENTSEQKSIRAKVPRRKRFVKKEVNIDSHKLFSWNLLEVWRLTIATTGDETFPLVTLWPRFGHKVLTEVKEVEAILTRIHPIQFILSTCIPAVSFISLQIETYKGQFLPDFSQFF